MRRVLSAVVAVSLLVGLGALAVMVLPGAQGVAAPIPISAAAPDAPAAARNFNMIAIPLNATNQFTTAGYTFKADGLMKLAGGGTKVKQVAHWRSNPGIYDTWTWDPDEGFAVGTDFDLQVGQAYWLLLESTADEVISFVGDVPAAGSVSFPLVRGNPCMFNQFSIPLDQSTITDANALLSALGAKQVSHWVASGTFGQTFESLTWDPDEGMAVGTNFTVQIGYPYVACLEAGTPTQWP